MFFYGPFFFCVRVETYYSIIYFPPLSRHIILACDFLYASSLSFFSFGIVFFFKNERLVTIHGLGYIDTGLCFLFSSNAYEWRISELVFYI